MGWYIARGKHAQYKCHWCGQKIGEGRKYYILSIHPLVVSHTKCQWEHEDEQRTKQQQEQPDDELDCAKEG